MPQNVSQSLQPSRLSQAIGCLLMDYHRPLILLMSFGCLSVPAYAANNAEPEENPIPRLAEPTQMTVPAITSSASGSVQASVLDVPVVVETAQSMSAEEQQMIQLAEQEFAQDALYNLDAAKIDTIAENVQQEVEQTAQQATQQATVLAQQEPVRETVLPPVNDTLNDELQFTVEPINAQQQETEVSTLLQDLAQQPVTLYDVTAVHEERQGTMLSDTGAAVEKSWLDKLLRRDPVFEEQRTQKMPKINVMVCGANSALSDNIKGRLAGFTVDAFKDFERAKSSNERNRLIHVADLGKTILRGASCDADNKLISANQGAAFAQISMMTQQAAQAVGYYQATFEYQKIDDSNLIVWVDPNQPVLVASQDIKIIETDESGQENTAKNAAFRVISAVPDLRKGDVLNHAAYEATKSRILTAASNLGYFDGHWRMHDVKVTLPDNTADILIKYDTQQRYKLADVEFRMTGKKTEFPLRDEVLKNLVPFEDNADYGQWRINTLSNNLTNSRYFNYVLVNVAKPDPEPAQLDLPPDLIELAQKQAEENKAEQATTNTQSTDIIADADALNDLGIATTSVLNDKDLSTRSETVDEMTELKNKAKELKKVPVVVYLNADNLNNLEAGIGYGTDTGVRLRSQYRRAIVNDRGHSFDANIELSEIRQSLDVRYMIPVKNKNPLNDYYNIVAGYEREVRDSIGQGVELNIESAVLGAERVRKRSLGEWRRNLSVRYRLDRIDSQGIVDPDDIPDAFRIITDSPEQQSLLLGYEISKTTQNNRVNPTEGFRQFYRTEIGSESLLTETDLAIVNAGWRFIYSLGENANHQFVGGADVGYIFTDNFDHVPYNLRYFAGGDQSIRGFDYKSLAPKEDDLLIGGQALSVGSMEYNYQFKPGWRAAIFTDVGNAYDDKFNNDTKYGAGLGIRWASPVGPIRIDIAAGVSEPSIPIRLHFFIGPAL